MKNKFRGEVAYDIEIYASLINPEKCIYLIPTIKVSKTGIYYEISICWLLGELYFSFNKKDLDND